MDFLATSLYIHNALLFTNLFKTKYIVTSVRKTQGHPQNNMTPHVYHQGRTINEKSLWRNKYFDKINDLFTILKIKNLDSV